MIIRWLGQEVMESLRKHLKWFGENLAKVPYTGIVLYTGKYVQRFGEGYYAVPMSCLA